MLKITGTAAYLKKTKKQRAMITQGAQNFTRKQSRAILKDLVLNAPQWSGNTAAMWQIRTPSVQESSANTELYQEHWEDLIGKPSYIGDEGAWKVALAAAKPALRSIKYNTRIDIRNPSPVADDLATEPDVESRLRRGNFIPNDVMAVNFTATKYKLSTDIVELKDVLLYTDDE